MTKDSPQIPVPEMLFNLHTPFTLSCQFYRGIDIALDDVISDDSCNQYLTQPKHAEDDDDYYGYFTHDNVLNYEDPNIDPNAIAFVAVSIDVDAAIAKSESPLVIIIDAEKNPLKLSNGELNGSAIDNLPNNIRECITNNMYYVPKGQMARLSFNRQLRRILHKDYKANLGISPTYEEKPYILSNLQTEPIEPDTLIAGVFSSKILLNVQYFFVKVETEQKTRTVFSIVGLVGGAYGTNVIRPWGCVQYSCGLRDRTHNKLRKELPVIPLVNDLEISNTSREISREEHIALQRRVHSLEVFLREYVVDVKYLKGLKADDVIKEVEGNDLPPANFNYNHYNNSNITPPYGITTYNIHK
ncbi:20307_t:CDS:2 [Funneliformis geosporum]|uniref:17440_t:CDS:1 n=1 Tax=Funneliformis geosporum TaxID=1117311 RepID=A0A9W4SLS3_9GLOM|nr:17440_t:CDS:2 [Funneliformis geosporum]CAI2174035.1 20307_t:CDS:2 [Funneliformis geosporum]